MDKVSRAPPHRALASPRKLPQVACMNLLNEENRPTTKHPAAAPALRRFDHWLASIPASPTSGWRWRKNGWIKTVNICGRCYISTEEIARFLGRAEAGEFSKEHKVPAPRAA